MKNNNNNKRKEKKYNQLNYYLKIIYLESSTASSFTAQPLGYWNPQNMRRLLEDFAKNNNLDPLDPETWYSTSSSDIREIKV